MVLTSASIIAGAHDDKIVNGKTVKFWLSAAKVINKEVERLLGEGWNIGLHVLLVDGNPRDYVTFAIQFKEGYKTWGVDVNVKNKSVWVAGLESLSLSNQEMWPEIGKFLQNFEYIKDFIEYTVGA